MRSALALLLSLAAVTALAQEREPINPDRPGIADGSQTVGSHVFQVELGGERDHFAADQTYVTATPLLLRYGVTAPFELRVETQGYGHATGGASGINPVSLGFKYHFLDKPSLGIIGRYFPASGSGDFKSEHPSADLRLAADVDLSETWSINPNIGVSTQDEGDGRFTAAQAALTLQYNISKKLNVFVDAGLQSPESRGGGASLLTDAGAAWILGNDTQLDVSVGWGARGGTPNVFWSAGISRRF